MTKLISSVCYVRIAKLCQPNFFQNKYHVDSSILNVYLLFASF